MSTRIFAPSFSKTLSPGRAASRSILYCKPEQPPPTTLSRSPSFCFCSSAARSCLILWAAFSVMLTPTIVPPNLRDRLGACPRCSARRSVQRRKLAQPRHLLGDTIDRLIHLLLGVAALGAGRERNVFERHHERLALDVGEAQIHVARQTLRRAVHVNLLELAEQTLLEPFPQTRKPLAFLRRLGARDLARFAEADDRRNVQRAGP